MVMLGGGTVAHLGFMASSSSGCMISVTGQRLFFVFFLVGWNLEFKVSGGGQLSGDEVSELGKSDQSFKLAVVSGPFCMWLLVLIFTMLLCSVIMIPCCFREGSL